MSHVLRLLLYCESLGLSSGVCPLHNLTRPISLKGVALYNPPTVLPYFHSVGDTCAEGKEGPLGERRGALRGFERGRGDGGRVDGLPK